MNGNNNQIVKMIYLITQIGFTMLTTVFLSIGIGYLIDKAFGTKTMAWFIVLGVVAGFRSVYILVRRFIGDDNGKSQGS
ncbi:MAG: AtpZ/AtpI family protein [Lachnospiraceae bacterium]|nr:AtpZ/AtpI family protein [Lachnospiraceae bacterium]